MTKNAQHPQLSSALAEARDCACSAARPHTPLAQSPLPHSRLRKSLVARRAHLQWARRQWARRRRPARRRGVILLVTLVLLTLFTMMLITFVIATVTNRQGVTPSARAEQTGDSPDGMLHDAFLQVVRGPRNPNSPLRAHSLLEDMLGSDSMVLTLPYAIPNVALITATSPTGGGTVPSPLVQLLWSVGDGNNPYPRANQLPPPPGHYAGRSIMLLNGGSLGKMGRVISSDFDGTNYTLVVYGFTPANDFTSTQRFLVNGKPFSGTGFGFKPLSFDPTAPNANSATNPTYTRLLDAYYPSIADGEGRQFRLLQALTPNHSQSVFAGFNASNPDPSDPYGGNYSLYGDPAGPGGAHEEYDAADSQNMHMSMAIWNGAAMQTVLPSFHRPDLIQYWWQTIGITPPAPYTTQHNLFNPGDRLAMSILRKVVMRPLPFDHPNFTGSNPAMSFANVSTTVLPTNPLLNALVNGPWDVDNDNDGEMDSVWLDIGLPVQTAPDGRRYKPLMAFLIRDLDGRLNLNAHSSWRHAPSANPLISRFLPVQVPFSMTPGTLTQPGAYRLRVGQGYGPAEISLSPLFSPYPNPTLAESQTGAVYSVTAPAGEMQYLLGGNPGTYLDGRYGEVQLTGNVGLNGGSPYPGISALEDPFSWIQRSQFPQIYTLSPQVPYCYLPTTASNGGASGFQLINTVAPGLFVTLGDGSQIWVNPSGYGTPHDLDGDGMLATDVRGQPLYIDFTYLATNGGQAAGFGEPNDTFDNQYEVDLSLIGRNASYTSTTWSALPTFTPNLLTAPYASQVDATFSADELERILRSHDADAMTLPDRLPRLAPNAFTSPIRMFGQPDLPRMAHLVTTESYDLTQPSMAFAPHDMVQQIYATTKQLNTAYPNAVPTISDSSIASLLRAQLLIQNSTYLPLTPTTTLAMSTAIKLLLPPDVLMGQKFDINRMLGNGRDDNGNGAVDEPGEVETAWQELYGAAVPLDLNNDGQADGTPNAGYYQDINADGMFDARDMPLAYDANGNGTYDAGDVWATLPRQLLARHLYVLMMLLKDPNFTVNLDLDGNGASGQPQDVAYYFAQLAVNMVDFRDRDAIMTPFEFDMFPFQENDGNIYNGTWDVDGVINATIAPTTVVTSSDDTQAYRGLVWGCERPELIITETMATHDRRTRDTNKDSTSKLVPDDSDFDQVRRPQGSLFVELMNPNAPMAVGNKYAGEAPNELYAYVPGTAGSADPAGDPQFGVKLQQLSWAAPNYAGSNPPKVSPVWRLATLNLGSTPPATRLSTLNLPLIDRMLYFITPTPTNGIFLEMPLQNRAFYAQPSGLIAPGTYALIGPAAKDTYGDGTSLVTHLGMRDISADPGNTTSPYNGAPTSVLNKYPRTLYFGSSPGSKTGMTDVAGNPLVAVTDVKPTVGVWAAPLYLNGSGAPLTDQTNINNTLKLTRFSLSEPDKGYKIVRNLLSYVDPSPPIGMLNNQENGYYDATAAGTPFPTVPYDKDPGNFDLSNALNVNDQLRNQWNYSVAAPYTTIQGASTVCLQRLANPMAPWDKTANPYIIVDQMPVDLSYYNSEMNPAPAAGSEEFAGMVPKTVASWNFDTRRRSATQSVQPNLNNVWYQGNVGPGTPVSPAGATTALADMLSTALTPSGGPTFMPWASLGYLNNEYGVTGSNRWTGAYPAPVAINGVTTLNATTGVTPQLEYNGDPTIPFPWLNWNNRPYISGKELMLVPTGSPASLLREMTLSQSVAIGTLFEPALPGAVLPLAEFQHLTNPFSSPRLAPLAAGASNGGPITAANASPNLYRLLDFVHVPSRYTGTQDWIPPGNISGISSAPHYLHPPFNQVSRNRDPGKMNINTIYDPAALQGLLDERLATDSGLNPPWFNLFNTIFTSRQGSGGPVSLPAYPLMTQLGQPIPINMLTAATAASAAPLPSIIAKPFRAATGNSLVPLAQMRIGQIDGNEREVNSTLLRADPNVPTVPMLEAPGASTAVFKENAVPTYPVPPAFANTQTSPYFAYEEIRRLDNLVTTRSNVYAVWITMGYFEVKQAPNAATDPDYAAKYPDGWTLGPELGADTGDIQRHRSFYIYDRSIPVGFERGENHNVDRGILVQRYIE